MAQREIRFYGSAAIVWRLSKAVFWCGVIVYLLYIAIDFRPSRYSLAEEPSPVVSLTDFTYRTDLHERNEVNVIGRIASREGFPVSDGVTTEHLFLFFAPDSGPEDTVVRAAVLMEDDELDLYEDELAKYPDEKQVIVNGRVLSRPTHARAVETEIKNRGLSLSGQFIYITPWLGDRRDPIDNGPWFDIVLISISSLIFLYHLLTALRWYRNDRKIIAMLSKEDAEMLKRRAREDMGAGDTVFSLVLAVIIIAFVVGKYM